ncbi:chaplin family protein [Streptomyces capparidis]
MTVLAVSTAGLAGAAGPVSAGTVVGGLNPAFGNSCVVDSTGGQAAGTAVRGPGLVNSNAVQLPLDSPGNSCGTAGIGSLPFRGMGISDRGLKTAVTPVVWER